MKELTKLIESAWAQLVDRIDALEKGAKASLFGPLREATIRPEDPILIRESKELGMRQQFRPKHGETVFLHDHIGRGRFFHSVSVASGSDHVHVPSARYEQDGSPHFGFGVSGQLRVRKTADREELLLIKYVVSGAAPDWLHPDLTNPDDHIRILEVVTLARDGQWLIDDTDQRRILNG